ncbi:hypothetical protein [Edwardsiella phage GF-2]|uniref:Uncharacterized protein n=1 Tax=Edwardsiella phage GF-2 TaxID=1537091 RepID=A0A077K9Y6_9CAUD|nr:hypothetical protein VC56_gp75 [Edwardsiella phage GF-2]BAP28946.1 hypothetical protein [Edwardsiella phage GF-2]
MTLYDLYEIERLEDEIKAHKLQITRLKERIMGIIKRSNANKEKPHERA